MKNRWFTADANLWRENLRIYEITDIVIGISETDAIINIVKKLEFKSNK